MEAAHCLPNTPVNHKCANVHGHSYRIRLEITGDPDPVTGWIFDWDLLTNAFAEVMQAADHQMLNKIPGLDNPTCELFAAWIWKTIKPRVAGLSKVTVFENPVCGVEYCE